MKKHYKFVFTLQAPLPVRFVYREEANAFPAALRRAAARFRIDTKGRPIRKATIELDMLDIIEGLQGRPDVEGGEPQDGQENRANAPVVELEEEAPAPTKKPTKEPKKVDKEVELEEEEDDEDEDIEEDDEEAADDGDDEEDEAVGDDETEDDDDGDEADDVEEKSQEEVEEEALDYDSLIVAIKKAKNQKDIDALVEKFVTPYEWSTVEMKAFDVEIARTKDGWEIDAPAPAKTKKTPGKSAFESIKGMGPSKKK